MPNTRSVASQRTPSGYGVHGGSMGAAGRVTFKIGGEPWTPPQFGTGRLGPTENQDRVARR